MSAATRSEAPLLSVRNLSIAYASDEGPIRAVDRVSFDLSRGKTLALVGESGSGKSSVAHAIARLTPPETATTAGRILFEGQDLVTLPEPSMRKLRGARVGTIFQEPSTALDPVYTVGAQIAEAIRAHERASGAEVRRRCIELLREVGFPRPEERLDDYPHELSGGMRQRVLIAIAIASSPVLLVADEPTSALDATVKAHVSSLIARLKTDRGMSLLLVTHDLGVVAELADEVAVLYAGQVVEWGPKAEVLGSPRHPYTQALLASLPPRLARPRKLGTRGPRLPTIPGSPPSANEATAGCRFAPRCSLTIDPCRDTPPDAHEDDGVKVRCHLAEAAPSSQRAAIDPRTEQSAP